MTNNSCDNSLYQERLAFVKHHLAILAHQGWHNFDNLPHHALFPEGARQALFFLEHHKDNQAIEALNDSKLPTKDKVAFAIAKKIMLSAEWGGIALLRQTHSWLSHPLRLPLAIQLRYDSSDAIWRALGDQSLDYNFYSKRMTVMSVLVASNLNFIAQDDDHYDITPFVQRRIQDVFALTSFLTGGKKGAT